MDLSLPQHAQEEQTRGTAQLLMPAGRLQHKQRIP